MSLGNFLRTCHKTTAKEKVSISQTNRNSQALLNLVQDHKYSVECHRKIDSEWLIS